MIKGQKNRYAKKLGSKKKKQVVYLNCVMEKQGQARGQKKRRQKNPISTVI